MAHKGSPLSAKASVKKALKQIAASKLSSQYVKLDALKVWMAIESREAAGLHWAYNVQSMPPQTPQTPRPPMEPAPPVIKQDGIAEMRKLIEKNLGGGNAELPKD